MAGCVKFIQINRGIIEVAELPGSCVKIRSVIKIRIFFFYPPIAAYSREEENRQLEKLHSTLKVFVGSPAAVLRLVVARLAAPLREASAGLLVAVFRVFFPRHSLFYLVAGHR